MDDSHLIIMYDRIPNGWNPIPAESTETNSIWVVRVTLTKANAGCLMQIACEARMQRQVLKIVHPMDLLDLSYRRQKPDFVRDHA